MAARHGLSVVGEASVSGLIVAGRLRVLLWCLSAYRSWLQWFEVLIVRVGSRAPSSASMCCSRQRFIAIARNGVSGPLTEIA